MAYRAPQKVGATGKQTGGTSTTRVPKAAKPKVTKARSTTTKYDSTNPVKRSGDPVLDGRQRQSIDNTLMPGSGGALKLPHEMIAGKLTGK